MLLILEDDAERIQGFVAAFRRVDPALEPRVWRNTWYMIREVEQFLPGACLLSLDHDLDSEEGSSADPGTGGMSPATLQAFHRSAR